MLVLSMLRTSWKKRGAGVRWRVGVPVRPV
jgi:hypothetical protein